MSILTYPSESLILDPGWVDAVEAQRPTAFYRVGESVGGIAVDEMGGLPLNLCMNPDFEDDLSNWFSGTNLAVNGSGPAISLTATSPFSGAQCAQVISGAVTGQGFMYRIPVIPGGLVVGQTYTASVYLRGNAGGEQIVFFFGTNVASDFASSTEPALTTSWVRHTISWTVKVATTSPVYFSITNRTSIANNFFVDACSITQGTAASGFYAGTGGAPGRYIASTQPNLVIDPSFEADTVGAAPNAAWNTTGTSLGSQVTGAVLTAQTAPGTPSAQMGTKAMQVVTTAQFQGAAQSFPAVTFLLNVPYTFSFYAKGNAGGEIIRACIGVAGVENGPTMAFTLTTAWTRYSGTWIPTANRVNNANLCIINNNPSVAETFFVDAVQVTQTSGPTPYSDGTGIKLAIDGVPAFAPNTGLVFDGTGQGYVYLGNPASLQLNSVTLCAWIKTTQVSALLQTVVAKNGAWAMYIVSGTLQAYSFAGTIGGVSSGVSVADGKWHHVAISLLNGTPNGTIFYVDGVQVGATGTCTWTSQANVATIGLTNPGLPTQAFNGTIDEVAIFNYVLPSHEIAAVYAASAVGGRGVDLASGSNGFLLTSIDTPSPPRKRITASSPDTEGNIPVESQYDERTITVTTRSLPAADRPTWYAQIDRLMQKVAKINAEGGVLSRNLIGSEFNYFYDLTDAQADIPWDNVRYALSMDQDITITLLAKPLVRGSEIALPLHTEATLPSVQFTESGIRGDVPAIGRLVVTEVQAAATQLAVVWGLRSRYNDAAVSAALFYECETMTPQDAAVAFALAGSSGAGNNTIRHPSLPANSWTPVLLTDRSTVKMAHKGSYRVLLRCYSATNPQVRLVWGMGDLVSTVINPPVVFPNAGGFALIDLGIIRLGTSPQWTGVIQALAPGSTGGDYLACDCMFLIPTDECSGEIDSLVRSQSPLGIVAGPKWWPTLGANVTGVGSVAWSNPTRVQQPSSPGCQISLTNGQISNYLVFTGYLQVPGVPSGNFNIPAGATISGILCTSSRFCNNGLIVDSAMRLWKTGAPVGTSKPDLTRNWPTAYGYVPQFGGPTDLWGLTTTTLTPAYVNASDFGVALSVTAVGTDVGNIDWINMAIYYTTAGGYLDTQDAVLFPLQSAQISDHDVQRENAAGTFMVPAPRYQGDYLRVPPAGIEGRSVSFIVKASRGRINDADTAIDDISAQLFYTPRWLQHPDQ